MSITGNLRTLEFTELLQWLAQGQKTGALVINSGEMEKRIYFRSGKIIFSESNNPDEHLGSFLIRDGLIDEQTLSRAVKLQDSTQILLGKVLVTLGTITEEELHRILRRKTEESIYDLFNWTDGEFHFVPDDLPNQPMVPIEIDVTNVVLEGAKRLDEARRDSQETSGDQASRYAREIDDVLGADIFQEADLGETGLGSSQPAATTGSLTVDESLTDSRDSSETDVRRYYGTGSGTKTKTPLLAAAAALLLIVFGASAYFFFLRPEPAAGTADRASLEKSLPAPQPVDSLGLEENTYLLPEDPLNQDLDASADTGEIADESNQASQPDPDAEMQARYEAELATLKAELEQAQGVAAERDAAMQRLSDLEEQAEQAKQQAELERAMEAAREPEPEPDIVEVTEPERELTAGGDEPPTLGSTLPANAAASQAGNDFAEEMVDPTPEPLVEPLTVDTVQSGDLVEQGPGVTAPVLLSQPQPRYPTAALRLGREADINVRLLINHEGRVVEAKTLGRKAGMGFDQEALSAAKRTSWRPATKDGVAVTVWAQLTIKFRR